MDQSFEVHPCDAAPGAEIRGLDLRQALPQSAVAALQKVWYERLVLLFRDQDLSDDQHFAFTAQFGALEHTPQKLLELARGDGADRSAPEMTVISTVIENGVAIGRLDSQRLFESPGILT